MTTLTRYHGVAGQPPRFIVCVVGGARGFLELPESRVDGERQLISGGERSLFELATAIACLGFDVELRGHINEAILRTVTQAAGAAPRVRLPPRVPQLGEVVILPEAIDRDTLLAVHLSGAHGVICALAPPGLWGWSFRSGWSPPDPLAVAPDSVGSVASYQAIDALGFTIWAHSHGIAEAGEKAGVAVPWIGNGMPVPFPDGAEKTFDVAVIEENRWYGLASELARRMTGASVLHVPPVRSTYSLSHALAPARILLWPTRVEGASRISREARAVGTVPVALDTNPFATAADWGGGVVLVPDLDSIVAESTRLLSDRSELDRLAAEARASAREQEDWTRYVERVRAAIDQLECRDDAEARAELGAQLIAQVHGEARPLRPGQAQSQERADGRDRVEAGGVASDGTRQLLASSLGQAQAALAAARSELARYQSRRVVRMVDRSPLHQVARLLRRWTWRRRARGTAAQATASDQVSSRSPAASATRSGHDNVPPIHH